MLTVELDLSKRELELILKSLEDAATHSMGDPLGRADRERLAKWFRAQLTQLEGRSN